MNNRPSNGMMIVGTIVFCVTVAAWLLAEYLGIDTAVLLPFAVPVVGALFIAGPIGAARDAAQQAAQQTNGVLGDRIKAAVAAALADRDAARTRQAVGDVAEDLPEPRRAQTEGDQ